MTRRVHDDLYWISNLSQHLPLVQEHLVTVVAGW
jgi:hypothetical protein